MRTFNTQKEIDSALDERGNLIIHDNVTFNCDVKISGDIKAGNINAWNIKAWNIKAWNINAGDIDARNIDARNIDAGNINAWNIKAENIDARNIKAENIDARNISFYAICVSYASFRCKSAVGCRDNAKAICLDSEIVYTADTAVKGGKE